MFGEHVLSMTSSPDNESPSLTPDQAFSALGNTTRMDILRTLADADTPLSFSALYDQIGLSDSGQFNYHLNKLVEHFVRKREGGYELTRAGERIIEAVLSGAVTDHPTIEPTVIDQSCQYCGAPIGISYSDEQLLVFCTECPGTYGRQEITGEYGHLGRLYLPPAGLGDRSPDEIAMAARIWGGLETMAAISGVCPRCSASLTESVEVCPTHDAADGVCSDCGSRHAVSIAFSCPNCIYERGGLFGVKLTGQTEMLALLASHGINPIAPISHASIGSAMNYTEDVRSIDPLDVRFTFEIDDETITFRVDDELAIHVE